MTVACRMFFSMTPNITTSENGKINMFMQDRKFDTRLDSQTDARVRSDDAAAVRAQVLDRQDRAELPAVDVLGQRLAVVAGAHGSRFNRLNLGIPLKVIGCPAAIRMTPMSRLAGMNT